MASLCAALGCAGHDGPGYTPGVVEGSDQSAQSAVAEVYRALAPVAVRLHPLTRLERTADGGVCVVVHVELIDRYDQSGRWPGTLRVSLLRPATAPSGDVRARGVPGGESLDMSFTADLRNGEAHAAAYDWVTRTYVVRRCDMPAWIADVESGRGPDQWVTVTASFRHTDFQGNSRSVNDTLRLGRRTPARPDTAPPPAAP